MKRLFFFFLMAFTYSAMNAQELFVFSEPASNMPANSITVKASGNFGRSYNSENMYRFIPEIQFGFTKNFMLHIGNTFSNTGSPKTRWESVYLYSKYRFLSIDEMHRHFRMTVFGAATYSRNAYKFEELSIQGDRSGVQLGLIATQLLNKLAVSGTVSHTQAMDPSRNDKLTYTPERIYKSINYSFSAGYLILPIEYKSFNQLNMNVYAELLGQKTLDRKTYYLDFAPSLQFIFNSNTKLNLGYRFEVDGDQFRGLKKSFLISLEHTFYNALKKKN